MRSETDEFYCQQDPSMDKLKAEMDGKEIVVKFYNDGFTCETVFMTKDQAREFARQLLEICGEEG